MEHIYVLKYMILEKSAKIHISIILVSWRGLHTLRDNKTFRGKKHWFSGSPNKIKEQVRFQVILRSQDLSERLNRVMNIDLGLGNAQNERKHAPGKFDNFSKLIYQKIIMILGRLNNHFVKFLDQNWSHWPYLAV